MDSGRKTIVISLADYIKKIWTFMPVIVSWCVFCAAMMAFAVSVITDTEYTAETSIYILARDVISREERLDQSDLQVSSQMTSDGMKMMLSRQMAERVVEDLKASSAAYADLDMTAEELLDRVELARDDNSLLVTISVTDRDPYLACDLANVYRKAAAVGLMDKVRARGIQTVEEAVIPLEPSETSRLLFALAGAMLGIFSSLFFLFVLYVIYDAKRIPEDIKAI